MPPTRPGSGRKAADSSARAVSLEPPPYSTKLFRFGGSRVLFVRPDQRYLGRFALQLTSAFAYARAVGAGVMLVGSPDARHGALLQVRADDVRTVESPLVRLLARSAASVGDLGRRPGEVREQIRRREVDELGRYLKTHPDLPRPRRARLASRRAELKARSGPGADEFVYRRRLLADPVGTRLPAAADAEAARDAAALGIGGETQLVCVHARERGYELSGEAPRKGEAVEKGAPRWDEAARNARIETHFQAIDYLVERGYTVVRLGDPSMAPVTRPGVVDLATSPHWNPLLQLYCLFRSRFVLGGESGPLGLSYLTNTPLLAVNATDPIGTYPVRANGIFLLKTIVDRAAGRPLSGREHVSRERLSNLRATTRYQFVENTPEQILDAVEEMLDRLEHDTPESEGQVWFRELVTTAAETNGDLPYLARWGADDGFVGRGRLARSLADPWYDAERVARPAKDEAALT